MENFMQLASHHQISRSLELSEFALNIAIDIEMFSYGDDDCSRSTFVSKDGSKFIVEIACINHEYQCEDIAHVLDVLTRMADASRNDEQFQMIIGNAIYCGGDDHPVYEDMGPFLTYMEQFEVDRSDLVSTLSRHIANDLMLLENDDLGALGAVLRKEGSAYVVCFVAGEMEYSFANLEDARKFLVDAVNAAREDEAFKAAIDEAYQLLIKKAANSENA